MEDLLETNLLLTKILKTCQKSVGNYVFSQILYSANITPEQYDLLIQNQFNQFFSIHISLN
jgi:hypothetical protein